MVKGQLLVVGFNSVQSVSKEVLIAVRYSLIVCVTQIGSRLPICRMLIMDAQLPGTVLRLNPLQPTAYTRIEVHELDVHVDIWILGPSPWEHMGAAHGFR